MKNISSAAIKKKKLILGVWVPVSILLLIALVVSGLIAWLDDRNNRNELLLQARLVQKAINRQSLSEFSGSEADLKLPSYNILKEQLVDIRSASPKCRFIYLMGRNSEDEVFFFIDSEPTDSSGYSPPGQIYNEAPQDIRRVFLTAQENAVGPFSDRWGTWVSAFIPVVDTASGKVTAVLGMDIDARTWVRTVIWRSMLSISLFMLIGILIGLFLYIQNRTEREKALLAENKIALQNSENKYRGFFLNFRDAMMIIAPPDWKIISGNPAALEMFGIDSEKQLLTMNPVDLSPQYQPDGLLSAEKSKRMIEAALLQGSLFFEWVHKRSNGQEFPASVLLAKMEISGEVMLQVMVRDITESKRIEEDNRKHLQELEVFYKVSMGREERIIELKKEVAMLRQELDKCKKVS